MAINLEKIMREARATNRKRDASERSLGYESPGSGPLHRELQTISLALQAGLRTEDWSCVAEGLAMLEDCEVAVRAELRGNV